ncbi:MAG: FG-GAP repeat protein, partial [Methylococcales bacterium]|nr:FG-GAP repeat protein [Methylococcales bacterium]
MKKRLKNAAILTRPGPGFMGGALLVMLAIISPIRAGWLVEDQKLEGPVWNGETMIHGAYFGETVAISGDTAVVSARYNNELADLSGSAYVFVRGESTWSKQAKLKASDPESHAYFGSSIGISNNMIAVGASGKDVIGASEDSGKVYVFTRNGTTWSEQSSVELPASDRNAYNRFGESVVVSDDTLIVTAEEVDSDRNYGVAYVFMREGITWAEPIRLDGLEGNGYSGNPPHIAISDDTIVAWKHNSTNVLVFTRSGNTWSKQADLPAGLTFGGSFAISDDTIVVGDPSKGVVHIYTRVGSTWSKQDTLTGYWPGLDSNSRFYAQFGRSVSISGDTIVVGEPGIEDSQWEQKAHVFTRRGTTWKEQATLLSAEYVLQDQFGGSVAIDGNTVVVGSLGGHVYLGSAYVYDLTCDATYSLSSNQWRQISLPCDPGENNTVTKVFGDDITGIYGTDWLIYLYDNDGYVLLEADDTLSQGVGYWIIQTSGSRETLDMPGNSTPTPVTSTALNPVLNPGACLDLETAKGCFAIPLAVQANGVQWNMIGYPFVFTGTLDNARIQTETGPCVSG